MHTLNKWVLMAALVHTTWAVQAQDLLPLELEAEQRSISRLNVAQCLDTVKQTAAGEGYQQRNEPTANDQLGVYIGAAPLGGGSLVVYCIDLNPSTAYIIHTKAQVTADLMSPHQLNHKITQALTVATQP
ncbi:DUF6180 family protein [Alcaligenes parafaecalis]|uniref:DUF6180 family protein n=1 Tax=Alcaligenes parafaecalis TaxID=171260 RepID=A0ABT3VQA0_9BURK|nr:DUF6180 family protein [Alcaligenes parafaecalis]MCX5465727.1 DUF6180 family protein [Alcaligenes parafaecalis]